MAEPKRRAAVAERAARAGGEVALESFRGRLDVETKRDKNDLVTAADLAAQRAVVATVEEAFPGEVFVCEEDDGGGGDAASNGGANAGSDGTPDDTSGGGPVFREAVPETGPAWVVDPIDGTANYVRGSRLWTTSVAALVDGTPVGAATHQAGLSDTYAVGPEGVRRNGDALTVSDRTDPETFAVGLLGWWPIGERDPYVAAFEAAVDRFGDVRRIGSMQTVLAMVAEGSLEAAFVAARPAPWDAVAGALLVRRAGGIVTDPDGDPWTREAAGLVASNGPAHEMVCEAARQSARRADGV